MKSKDYTDKRIQELKELMMSNFASDRKAVDQYSKTNDEWKNLHNGLQRKMEDDRSNYITKEMMNRQSLLMVALMMLAIAVYEAFIK